MMINGVDNDRLIHQNALNTPKENHYEVENNKAFMTENPTHKDAQNNGENTSEEKIVETIEELNKVIEKMDVSIQYEKHEATNRMMIRLVNKENNEVIKELPSEKILDMAASLCEQAGLFIDERL